MAKAKSNKAEVSRTTTTTHVHDKHKELTLGQKVQAISASLGDNSSSAPHDKEVIDYPIPPYSHKKSTQKQEYDVDYEEDVDALLDAEDRAKSPHSLSYLLLHECQ